MKTLLLRLVGPMQSWGTQSRYSIRETNLEPSKSGVVGLLYAALGKLRTDEDKDEPKRPSLRRLAALRMGVRIDCPGVMLEDYHTVGGALHREGKSEYGVYLAGGNVSKNAELTYRYYLADARFLVGLESKDEQLLDVLFEKLSKPEFQIFLGRKAFVPSEPVWLIDGLQSSPLETALQAYCWLAPTGTQMSEKGLRRLIETDSGNPKAEVRHDVPLSFAERRFTIRYVKTDFISTPKGG